MIRNAPGPPITFSLKYFGSPPGGLRVERVSRAGAIVDNCQSVDRDPGSNGLVARLGHRSAGIGGAVAGDVDDAAVSNLRGGACSR